jgi:UDP-3-O-[3-hydroxymyristoyl] glucosamine N-acyltransferase
MKSFNIKQVLADLQSKYIITGNSKLFFFNNLSLPNEAGKNSLIFVNSDNQIAAEKVIKSKAQMVICLESLLKNYHLPQKKTYICVKDPKLLVAKIGNKCFNRKMSFSGIHPTTTIHPKAKIGKNVVIGPYTYIGQSKIGNNVIIYGNCYIYDDVDIGNDVILHAGCILGADGFGYVKNNRGKYVKFPQIMGVVVKDDVEIGANTCIDRGALINTVIGKGTKIDNLVHIGHNTQIGENTLITAHVIISGSTTIGSNCYFAPNASTNGHVTIHDGAFIATGAVVTKDIPKNQVWIGSPAKPIEDFKKLQKQLNKLYTRKYV